MGGSKTYGRPLTVATAPLAVPTANTVDTPRRPTTLSPTPAKPTLRTTKRLLALQPPRLLLTTMPGPRTPTVPIPTPGGASLTTLSRPTSTMTSSTPARSVLTTTSGPRITISGLLPIAPNGVLLPLSRG